MDRKALAKFINFFSVKIYAKTAIKLSVAVPNSRLPTNFQLNIFILKVRVSLQTLFLSLKQKTSKSAQLGNFCDKFSSFFVGRHIWLILNFHKLHIEDSLFFEI